MGEPRRGPGLGRAGHRGHSRDTAVLAASGAAPKAVLDLGLFRASLMTSTKSVNTAQVVLIALIWAVIAVINIVYARRHPGRP